MKGIILNLIWNQTLKCAGLQDTYIGMSITQVVNILRSHASHMQFQKSLLFNHLFVMRILLDKCIHLKSFIRENHLEDFK